jgi:hypothetical protein
MIGKEFEMKYTPPPPTNFPNVNNDELREYFVSLVKHAKEIGIDRFKMAFTNGKGWYIEDGTWGGRPYIHRFPEKLQANILAAINDFNNYLRQQQDNKTLLDTEREFLGSLTFEQHLQLKFLKWGPY